VCGVLDEGREDDGGGDDATIGHLGLKRRRLARGTRHAALETPCLARGNSGTRHSVLDTRGVSFGTLAQRAARSHAIGGGGRPDPSHNPWARVLSPAFSAVAVLCHGQP
jgi:hypothetical protein